MKQGVRGLERIVWRVKADNFEKCVGQLASVMRIAFSDPVISEEIGVKSAVSWEAGVEVVAPLNDRSEWAVILANKGEGLHSVVFGVDNLERSVADAEAAGFAVRARAEGLTGKSQLVKEAILQTIFGGQIMFAETED